MKVMFQQISAEGLTYSILASGQIWTVAVILMLTSGCDRREIEEQTVDKGIEQVPAASQETRSSSSTADGDADRSDQPQSSDERWIMPEGWTRDQTPRRMRLATLIAPDPTGPVEVAVTRFPGRVGGELANLNRWRKQLRLAPITQDELDEALTRFESPGFEGYRTRIESPAGVMLAAGVYEAAIDQTWFVRTTVPDAEIADRIEADLYAVAHSIALIPRSTDEGDTQ